MKPFRFEEPLNVEKSEININIETGTVAIEPHDQPVIWVEGEGQHVDVSVSRHSDVVYVTSEDQPTAMNKWLGRLSETPKVKMIIHIPFHCQIRLKVVTGSAIVQDVQAAVRAEVITGTLTLINLGDLIDAQVVTGTILYDGVLPEIDNHFSANTGKVHLNLAQDPDAQVHVKTVTGRIYCDFDLVNQKRSGSFTGDHLSGIIGEGTSNLWAKTVTGTIHLKRRLPKVEA
ncbi:MAG: hypothetical protein WAM60_07465, partial [Candidatus Promineifilaceae bacterium]